MRVSVRYTGRVQGVGFRATTLTIALRHSLTGWVRNEPDGSVLLELQGNSAAVQGALDEIRAAMSRNIQAVDLSPIADTGSEIGFEIEQ